MDRRQKKTRQAVYDAFTGLLGRKNYSSITVQEIIDAADIGRSTFYTHYETKDDLLKSLCEEVFSHVFSTEPEKEKNHDFSHHHGVKARITHILYHLEEHMDFMTGILAGDGGELFMNYFKVYLDRLFSPCVQNTSSPVPRDYLLSHMICDFAETVRWWTKHPDHSPEEISSFFFETTPVNDCE
ncbi:MAG: TetR/AcrR family transcriptional regulator [Lachnospiraceae bacterium]|nr:TetR/AcrR family transcriptional regulator [Lachnospiraceae bacterium]